MSSLDLQQRAHAALRDVKLGTSIREAARKWDVPRSYISRRLNGIPTRKETYAKLQAVSPILETQLAHWAVGQARLGFAPPLTTFRFMAQKLVNASGGSHTLGQEWHTSFVNRHEAIKSTRSKIINYNRVHDATVSNIHLFFDRLDAPELADIPPGRYYNTDEMGIGQRGAGDHWVISEATNHVSLKKDVERGEWITALECVGYDGVALAPLVIFKGADVQSQWFLDVDRDLFEDWRFKRSPKGWTSNPIAMDWMADIFIPHVRASHGNQWVVLVCDGYDAHTNNDFLWLCLSNKVWLVFYEPHCSHVVQVLDVRVFGLLKKKLKALVGEDPNARAGLTLSKEDMLNAYREARMAVLTPKAITNAWRNSGIWPRNREKPLSSKSVIREDIGVARSHPTTPVASTRESTPDLLAETAPMPIKTPSESQELGEGVRKPAATDPTVNLPSQRQVHRKASKVLGRQAGKIANLEAQAACSTPKLEKTVRKVHQKVKRRLRSRVVYEDEASDTEARERELADTEECIVVSTGRGVNTTAKSR